MALRRHPTWFLDLTNSLLELASCFTEIKFVMNSGLPHGLLVEAVFQVMATASGCFGLPAEKEVLKGRTHS